MFVLVRAITYATLFVGVLLVFLPARILSAAGIVRPASIGPVQVIGMIVGVSGAVLGLWCILTFVFVGKGTQAPFDPPKGLVIRGPYRFVRNPMYLGAGLALIGASLFYESAALIPYLLVMLVLAQAFVMFFEEPVLAKKFGADYGAYRSRRKTLAASPMIVTRHDSAESFLNVAAPLLMVSEAENNVMIGVAQGLARHPDAVKGPYLATVSDETGVLACAVYLAPSKLVLTRANREPIVALAKDAYQAVPTIEGVTGPERSATDFAMAWSKLSGVAPALAMRLRIHETRRVNETALGSPTGMFRAATASDRDLLVGWTDALALEVRIPEEVNSAAVVDSAIQRSRLYVWEDNGQPVSMAAWTGKTPNGVRIILVYTPRELRGKGYATACVAELTRQQLAKGSVFCWLYTDLSSAASPNIFKKIGYWPVSDVSEYYLKQQLETGN